MFKQLFLPVLIGFALIFGSIFGATQSWAAQNRDEDVSVYREFIDGIGSTLYAFAWPTATYRKVSFEGYSKVYRGVDLKVKLHGISSFDNNSLWTEVIVKLRGGEVSDISWGRNNAILVQPGETMKALGQLLVDLNNEYSRSQRVNLQQSSGFKFKVKNDCGHDLKLALHYKKTNNNWRSIGWWEISANRSEYLKFSDGSYATTNDSIFYYYAEPKDGSFRWTAGTHNYTVNGKKFPMIKVRDAEGDSEFRIFCPGR